MTEESIKIHGKTKEMLELAPSIKPAWANFVDYVNQYNWKGNQWSACVPTGYNIRGYDNVITHRICQQLGPQDKDGRQGLFHPIHCVDLMDWMFGFFEDNKDINSLSADRLIREHMGYTAGTAHDALSDCQMVAKLMCKTFSWLRNKAKGIKFEGCMKDL